MVSTVRAWFVLVVFYHRSNVYPALQVMVMVDKRSDRSMLCVLNHVNMPLSYIDLLLLNAIQRLFKKKPTLDGLVASKYYFFTEVLFLTIFIINIFFKTTVIKDYNCAKL